MGENFRLKEAQQNLLIHLLNGNDSLGVLPTNFGKSIIYQLAPFVSRYLFKEKGHKQFSPHPVIIVISPINALIDDQINRCLEMNLRAVKLSAENISVFKTGEVDIIYTSPECLLDDTFRGILLSSLYQGRVIGIVVDEVHVVVKW